MKRQATLGLGIGLGLLCVVTLAPAQVVLAEQPVATAETLDPAVAAAAKEATAAKHIEDKDFAKAQMLLEQALVLDPNRISSQRAMAYTLDRQGQTDDAIAAYRKVLEASPDDALMHNNLGSALNKMGRYEEAVAVLEKAVALNPKDSLAAKNLATSQKNLATSSKDQSEVDDLLKRCEANPADPDAAYALARVYASRGRSDEAMDWLQKSVERGLRDTRSLGDDPAFAGVKADPRFAALSSSH